MNELTEWGNELKLLMFWFCRFKSLAHAANVWQAARWLQPAQVQIVRENSDPHKKSLSRALPGQVRVSTVPSHVHTQRQSAHPLQIQTSALQSGHQEVWSASESISWGEQHQSVDYDDDGRLILVVLLFLLLSGTVLIAAAAAAAAANRALLSGPPTINSQWGPIC